MLKPTPYIFAAITLSIVLIAGCATAPAVNYKLSSQKIEYKFIAPANIKSPVTNDDIIKEISNQITSSSTYPALYKELSSDGNYNVKGVSSTHTLSDITLSYINGKYFSRTGETYKSTKKVTYNIQISDSNNGKSIIINTPDTITSIQGRNELFLPIRYLLSDSELSSDLTTINMKMAPSLSCEEKIKGEINIKYNDESVYANFKRMLGVYSGNSAELKKYDITKEKIFDLPLNNESIPLKITVYPYRDGSKLVYKFYYKYKINSNGTNSYNKSDIEKLVAKIKQVAED